MFETLKDLLDKIFTEMRGLGVTVFSLGLIIMALLTAFGGEENKRTFQRGFVVCIFGIIVFFLAKPIVNFFQGQL